MLERLGITHGRRNFVRLPWIFLREPRTGRSGPGGVLSMGLGVHRISSGIPSVFHCMPVRKTGLIWKPTLVAIGSVLGVYVAAAYATNGETEYYTLMYPIGSSISGYQPVENANQSRLCCAITANTERVQRLRNEFQRFFPKALADQLIGIYESVLNAWSKTSHSQVAIATVCAISSAMFLGSLSPRIYPLFLKHCVHHPFGTRSYTLLTAPFAHRGILHLTTNICCLWIMEPSFQWLSEDYTPLHLSISESSSVYHLFAFIMGSAVVSTLCSHYVFVAQYSSRVLARSPKSLFSIMDASAGWNVPVTSGLSGVVCATFSLLAISCPDTTVYFSTFDYEMRARNIFLLIFAGDLVGLLARRGTIDHAMHMGGWLFGGLYAQYGLTFWEKTRIVVSRLTNGPGQLLHTRPRSVLDVSEQEVSQSR
ncbi:hypothetical protein OBBRIDRAFT_177574 [Obba rivulosa]|uniref:Peptidase S54 rhomboid domain-containing protein n=1 Tax=Obba rivulosa TaxID=1052685 RepID=A0A8E2DLQ1_9APHY|nr:hypothetical protein OBBRIDRAFT_177574 [Obba rivulosa]